MSKFHLDLFSGIGGFAIAAQACGYTTIGFCEREPYAQQILKERFGAVLADASTTRPPRSGCESQSSSTQQQPCNGDSKAPRLHDDIFTLNGAEYAGVDLLTGGFPCQPFSVAGKRRGAEDDRAIWPEMLRVIREAKPTWIIGENVSGIVTMELDNILSDLESLGYSAWPLVIPACAVDARHRRDRVWIVAHADSKRGCLREAYGSDASNARQSPVAEQGQDARQLEPAILRMADGIPEGLDGGARFCQWPEEDYATPRVTTGIKHRAHRLKGLGNSIVPQVAEEIIRAITNLR
jgi:DNA (cytosine-5)-methyltransferase 1